MAEEKKVKFSGDSSDLSSAFQKIREDAKSLNQGLIEDAMKYSKVSKEQVGYIQEQIKAIERRNAIDKKEHLSDIEGTYTAKLRTAGSAEKRDTLTSQYKSEIGKVNQASKADELQIKLLKDLVETIKVTAKEEIASDKKNAEENALKILSDKEGKYTQEEKFQANIVKSLIPREEERKESFYSALTRESIRKGVDDSLGLIINAKSSEDIVKPALATLGMAAGGGVGSLMDMANVKVAGSGAGDTNWGVILSKWGQMMGERFGDAYNRHIEESNSQQMSRNRLSAITRQGGGVGSDFGLNQGQLMDVQNQLFRASYSQKDLANRTRVGLGVEKGYGVDQNTLLGSYGTQTLTDQSTTNNLGSVIAALEKKGLMKDDNRLPLGNFLQNQTQLITTFAQTMERANQNSTADIMLKFNKMGGGYDFTDPRSLGRIQAIHGQLSNPGNDFTQAANFGVLRKTLGPNASFLDIMKAQEQGLGGEHGAEFMKGTIDLVKQRGGSKENQILSLRSRFPGMTIEQAQKMIEGGSDAFAGQDFKELTGQQQREQQQKIIGEGTSRVTGIEKDTAVIADAFAKGAIEGMTTVAELFTDKVISLFNVWVKENEPNWFNPNKETKTNKTKNSNLGNNNNASFYTRMMTGQ